MSPDLLAQVATPVVGHGFPPHWGWYIVLYFFFGGLCAGSYFIATLLMLLGDPRDRETIRLGYLISFPLLLVCAVLLILDLGVPLRFWHMLFQSENVPELVLKPWSPISLGTWILTIFGLFSFVAFVGALLDSGRLRWGPAERTASWAASLPRPLITAWNVIGSFFGFALAGYTGVLVTATTIPVWQNAQLLGGLFLVSAASASYALLVLLLLRRGRTHSDPSVAKLARADRFTMVLEFLLIVGLVLALGATSRPITTGGFGVLFWLGAVGLGVVVPLILHRTSPRGWDAHRREVIAAICVLIGGLILRFVVVMSPQYPSVPLWAL
ncbi:MAG TPA: NrfD/PsrC family molybdoenzyme membrane anchor subunit [Gemmatimonadales bacterium]|nr:NrfD/PsrC family molybdoenzyme membrane anchor subunit [Gemmatimonadales bacterium]